MPQMYRPIRERELFVLFESDVDTTERYDRWDEYEEERGREMGYRDEGGMESVEEESEDEI